MYFLLNPKSPNWGTLGFLTLTLQHNMQSNHRATTALIMKEYSHILYQIKQQKLGYNV